MVVAADVEDQGEHLAAAIHVEEGVAVTIDDHGIIRRDIIVPTLSLSVRFLVRIRIWIGWVKVIGIKKVKEDALAVRYRMDGGRGKICLAQDADPVILKCLQCRKSNRGIGGILAA